MVGVYEQSPVTDITLPGAVQSYFSLWCQIILFTFHILSSVLGNILQLKSRFK